MESIGVTLQWHLSYKKMQRETLCNIQLSSLIFLVQVTSKMLSYVLKPQQLCPLIFAHPTLNSSEYFISWSPEQKIAVYLNVPTRPWNLKLLLICFNLMPLCFGRTWLFSQCAFQFSYFLLTFIYPEESKRIFLEL